MEEESSPPPVGGGADRGRHIVRGLGSLTIQSVLSAFLGFVLTASLLRFLPQIGYGAYSGLTVTVGIAGAIAGFGLNAAAVRHLAPAPTDEKGPGWGAAKAALYLTIVLAAVVSLVLAAVSPYLAEYFLKSSTWSWVFYLGALYLFTSTVAGPVQALLQGMRRYSLLAKVLLGSRFVAVSVAVVGVALYHSLAIAVVSLIVFSLLIVLSALPFVLTPLRRADPRPYYSTVMRYAAPLGLAGLVGAVAGNADIVVVGGYLSPNSLAIYNGTVVISSVLSAFFVSPLVTALFAETSFSSESEEEVRLGTSLAIRFSIITLLPASLFAAAMAPQLFNLFSGGGAYIAGIPYLEIITVFYVFTAVQTVATSIMQGVSRTRQVLIVGAITALGEVALSASLVPGFGLAGAAYSRVSMFVVGCGLSLFFIRRYLPRPVDYRFLAKALLASIIPALIVYVQTALVSNRVITIVPYTLLGLAVFAVCARLLRLLSDEDKSYLSHLLPAWLQWITKLV
jgi:O-antigen/teichoic acid export membrane protein